MKTLQERFDERYTPEPMSGCWLWAGTIETGGYGQVWVREYGRLCLAHRLSWSLHCGDPGKSYVLHRCDNPPCVNPAHLFLGTHSDNMRDRSAKGRHPRARLTPARVLEMRRLYAAGDIRQAELAVKFGVTSAQVSTIIRRAGWTCV